MMRKTPYRKVYWSVVGRKRKWDWEDLLFYYFNYRLRKGE